MSMAVVASAQSFLQRKSNWSAVTYPQDKTVAVRFKVPLPIFDCFTCAVAGITPGADPWRNATASTGASTFTKVAATDSYAPATLELPTGAAKVTHRSNSTLIEFSVIRLPSSHTYFLYSVEPSGKVFKLGRVQINSTTQGSLRVNIDIATFMLVLSISDKLYDLDKDPNIILVSLAPEGFHIVPKGS